MSKTISWCITVCTELNEITKLLNFLQTRISKDDEIVIQYDSGNVTDEVLDYLKIMDQIHDNHIVVGFPLNMDFASFKNNLTKIATKEYIVQLDADELPSEFMVENLGTVLERNPVDLVFVPRINTVEGLTEKHIKQWGWRVDDQNRVNFPDYQTRIYRRTDDITWMNKVHERITGYNNFSNFPASDEWCLTHHKTISKQEQQNSFYETI
jgi:glycosyltransferase involved in cell wall biosynthesis